MKNRNHINTSTSSYHNYQMLHDINSSSFLKRLQQNLQDISQELQISNNKINQLNKLLQIMTEQRNYYHQELKKSQTIRQKYQSELRKQKMQQDSKQILINQLKKANRLLTEEIQILNQNLEETKFLFQAQEQQIDRIRKQKDLIQNQWNRVIKQVNSKMIRIQKKQHEQDKQNNQFLANLPLQEKVRKALKKLDREIQEEEHNSKDHFKRTHTELKESPISSTSGNQILDNSYSYI